MKFIYNNFEVILIALISLIMMIVATFKGDYSIAILFAVPFWANIIILHIKSNS